MFDLYKGATRPAMMFGVPTDALLWAFVGVGVASVAISIVAWAIFPFVVFVMRMITKRDDRAFRQLGLYFDTKLRADKSVKEFWGATTYTPIKKSEWSSWSSQDIKKLK